jgi:xanthine dehydrogenase accessory factor
MIVVVRGGGDLGSGIALRLFRSGFNVVVTEISMPVVLRRTVSFANAVYQKEMTVEDAKSRLVVGLEEIHELLNKKMIPVVIDPDLALVHELNFDALVDARMLKRFTEYDLTEKPVVIGVGPGFVAKENCHAVIESNRGHFLGRVIWSGAAQKDTGIPGKIGSLDQERVIRSPNNGIIHAGSKLGEIIKKGDIIGYVGEEAIIASIDGCLRGLMHDGIFVREGEKIGDLDPRMDPSLINFVSEKSLAIGGGVLEAVLSYFQCIK